MNDVNKSSRRRLVGLVPDEQEENEFDFSGDFRAEGSLFSHFKDAEIWIPTEVWADFVLTNNFIFYGIHLQIGIVPPEDIKVKELEVRVIFTPPVEQIGAWLPNDCFSKYSETFEKKELKGSAEVSLPKSVYKALPGIDSLLPQLSAEYSIIQKKHKTPKESVIRTISDGQRRLVFKLREDPKTGIDPMHFKSQVLLGISGRVYEKETLQCMEIEVNCRCGAFRFKNTLKQLVDVSFRKALFTSS